MFREEPIIPARASALVLATALEKLLEASAALRQARKDVPSYTGQYRDSDYIAEEQEAYNRAADAYADAVRAL